MGAPLPIAANRQSLREAGAAVDAIRRYKMRRATWFLFPIREFRGWRQWRGAPCCSRRRAPASNSGARGDSVDFVLEGVFYCIVFIQKSRIEFAGLPCVPRATADQNTKLTALRNTTDGRARESRAGQAAAC